MTKNRGKIRADFFFKYFYLTLTKKKHIMQLNGMQVNTMSIHIARVYQLNFFNLLPNILTRDPLMHNKELEEDVQVLALF